MIPSQGEIWIINLDPTIGSELQKERPCVVLSSDDFGVLPLKIVAPITAWDERYKNNDWMVHITPSRVNGLSKECCIDCFQVRSLSQARFTRKIGKITPGDLANTIQALKNCFE
jgi:mRNA interferase MazF